MKVLNAYAGIGGNRHLWPADWHITAVELDERIAAEYARRYPDDQVIVADAHAHLLEHAAEYDATWTSPPCVTHSKLTRINNNRADRQPVEPDQRLWDEIAFLRDLGNPFVVENVHTYYAPFIAPDIVTHRHYYWSSRPPLMLTSLHGRTITSSGKRYTADELAAMYGLPPIPRGAVADMNRALRNAVVPIEGYEIAIAAFEVAA